MAFFCPHFDYLGCIIRVISPAALKQVLRMNITTISKQTPQLIEAEVQTSNRTAVVLLIANTNECLINRRNGIFRDSSNKE